jgi:hypothetical protein
MAPGIDTLISRVGAGGVASSSFREKMATCQSLAPLLVPAAATTMILKRQQRDVVELMISCCILDYVLVLLV